MSEDKPQAAVEGVSPWPGLLTQPRRALRGAVDRRSWRGPLVLFMAVSMGTWVLQSKTGAPPPEHPPWTGHPLGDIVASWVIFGLGVLLIPFGCGRLIGGRGTLAEVFIVVLWCGVPNLLLHLPLDATGVALHGSAWWTMQEAFAPSELRLLPGSALALVAIDWLVGLWCLGLYVVGLSEVHGKRPALILLLLVIPLLVIGFIAAIAAAVLVASWSTPGA